MTLTARWIAAVICSLSLSATGQTFPYDFTVFNDPYNDLVDPISVSNADVWDDPSYLVSIGFDVQLFDEITSVLAIMAPGAQVFNMNSANPDSVQALTPYYADIMNANDSMSVSPISYQVEGPPGNGVFKLEWKNVGFYNEWTSSNTYMNTTNFQLWLYQNSSIIEFRYGPNTIKSGNIIHFYPTGPLVMLAHNAAFDGSGWQGLWCVSGDPNSPVISPAPSGTQPLAFQALSAEPPSGTVYRFAPTALSMNEHAASNFRLWPTLTADRIHLSSAAGETIQIHDATGRRMTTTSSNSINPVSIDVSTWPAGYYIARNSQGFVNRFVKS